ncbi:DUF2891 domain-containing protein [Aureibaculum luteum]|uniref:DUF2891 domain-containing protein n=1 Tax=Aureibaculum luteum TaxID=1548456 RepID=UPI000E48FBB8|nr:DUF2891 domain-containing protein [Aureibaculum luteum]
MRYFYALLCLLIIVSCKKPDSEAHVQPPEKQIANAPIPQLTLKEANHLASLPIGCIEVEYPNKLNQTIGDAADLQTPSALHPAFYGCFDWHSSVHGHWSLVSLLKQFPTLDNGAEIKEKLLKNISKHNILKEVAYFDREHNTSYERTYGWAWLLKLAEEIHTWDDETARTLEVNLQPLTDLIVQKYIEFLPKLKYPIRVGEHANTAFGLSFAYDYAKTLKNIELAELIEIRANDFYFKDADCPISWEPGGFDFLSPCLEEAALMKRVLPQVEFKKWMATFLPQLSNKNFTLAVGEVSDRSDGKLVHLDGVNFSRAWSLNKIAESIPEYKHLQNIANQHINNSLPNIVGDSYEGGHWLGSFAIYALNSIPVD